MAMKKTTALRQIAALHNEPHKVEIETWHDDEPCPTPEGGTCVGHYRTIETCGLCGAEDGGGEGVTYFEWPCQTLKLALAGLED